MPPPVPRVAPLVLRGGPGAVPVLPGSRHCLLQDRVLRGLRWSRLQEPLGFIKVLEWVSDPRCVPLIPGLIPDPLSQPLLLGKHCWVLLPKDLGPPRLGVFHCLPGAPSE